MQAELFAPPQLPPGVSYAPQSGPWGAPAGMSPYSYYVYPQGVVPEGEGAVDHDKQVSMPVVDAQQQAAAAQYWQNQLGAGIDPTGAAAVASAAPDGVGGDSDERELKRQRRKQSNRESARRSRLRKQAESDELGTRVDALAVENEKLRNELNRLKTTCETLTADNESLAAKLSTLRGGTVPPTAAAAAAPAGVKEQPATEEAAPDGAPAEGQQPNGGAPAAKANEEFAEVC